jgi:hypothetical protein
VNLNMVDPGTEVVSGITPPLAVQGCVAAQAVVIITAFPGLQLKVIVPE